MDAGGGTFRCVVAIAPFLRVRTSCRPVFFILTGITGTTYRYLLPQMSILSSNSHGICVLIVEVLNPLAHYKQGHRGNPRRRSTRRSSVLPPVVLALPLSSASHYLRYPGMQDSGPPSSHEADR